MSTNPSEREVAPAPGTAPVRVALVNDVEVIVHGVAAMLAPYAARVRVVDLVAEDADAASPDVDSTLSTRHAHVALFDTYGTDGDVEERVASLVADDRVDHVVLYTWSPSPLLLDRAERLGASGVLGKSLAADELVTSLERVVSGERPGLDGSAGDRRLSRREAEVLALIAAGRTNRQIADELFLSIDTVKTYVQRVFAKLGASNRTMAVVAAGELGLLDHPTRPGVRMLLRPVNHPNGRHLADRSDAGGR